MLNLTKLPRALRAAGYAAVSYRMIYARAVDGVILQAVQGEDARWRYHPNDLHEIAKSLGLEKLKTTA